MDRADRLKRCALDAIDITEQQAFTWIRDNPHVALIYALAAHESGWHGCACDLDAIVIKAREAVK